MTIDEARDVIRRNLRRLRKSRGLTQRELAAALGTAQPNIAQMEAGTRVPSLETLCRLAEALQVPPDLLLRPEIFAPATLDRR